MNRRLSIQAMITIGCICILVGGLVYGFYVHQTARLSCEALAGLGQAAEALRTVAASSNTVDEGGAALYRALRPHRDAFAKALVEFDRMGLGRRKEARALRGLLEAMHTARGMPRIDSTTQEALTASVCADAWALCRRMDACAD
ncbi:MAG: hypothetical protein EOM20_08815 [Spartobacteria bacterium]|nr:hypothetical protein [Spartobacteria bacterium]